jgi:hypothetical protein
MHLQSEPVVFETLKTKRKKADTLRRHGATTEEIAFLMGSEFSVRGRRVELNAMTSRQFIDFLEQKFKEHAVEKVIPNDAVMIQHARQALEGMLTEKALEKIKERIAKEAAETQLPKHLRQLVKREIQHNPTLPWDLAVANIVERLDLDQENSP